MTKEKFKFYADPGHGWLAVRRELIANLGLLEEITPYSYQKGGTVYLEEDQDAVTFLSVWGATNGPDSYYVEHKHSNKRSPIRNYEGFKQ